MNDKEQQTISLLVDVRTLLERVLSHEVREILTLDKISDHLKELTALLTAPAVEGGTESHNKEEDDEGDTIVDADNKQTCTLEKEKIVGHKWVVVSGTSIRCHRCGIVKSVGEEVRDE